MMLYLIPLFIGCLAGYLVNYLADVLPVNLKLVQPTCKNPACHATIRWMDYFMLRRCRACNKRPSLRVYLVLLVMIVFAIFLWMNPPPRMGFWLGFIVFIYLFLVALIDLEHRLVLGPVSLVGVVLGFLAGFFMHDWKVTLLGAVAGFGIMLFFYGLGYLFTRLRNRRMANAGDGEEALGLGDVILSTILGMLMGWPLILLNLFAGILLAGVFSLLMLIVLVITKRFRSLMVFFAYGPFLIITAFFLLYFPRWIPALLPIK